MKSTQPQSNTPDLTPMLDIVFIMLIFFVVTATFVVESGIDVNPPEPASAAPPSPQKKPLLVTISSQDRYLIDGTDVDVRMLESQLRRRFAEAPELPLVIDPHAEASTNAVVQLLDAARLVPGLGIRFLDRS